MTEEEFDRNTELFCRLLKIKKTTCALLKVGDRFPMPYQEVVWVFATEIMRACNGNYHLYNATMDYHEDTDEDIKHMREEMYEGH